MKNPGAARASDDAFIRVLLGISLLPAVGAVFSMAVLDMWGPSVWRWLACLTWYGLIVASARRRLARQGRAHWLLPLIIVHLLVLTPEAVLRATGFRYQSGVQFGYPKSIGFDHFRSHPQLFWTLPPSHDGDSWDLLGPEVRASSATQRVVALGDSVTYQGYPKSLEGLLSYEPDDESVEVLNLGVPGYSSHQGRVLAELYAQQLQADVVIIAFGWNDHWLARGAEDHRKAALRAPTRSQRIVHRLEGFSRTLQAIRYLASRLPGVADPHRVLESNRVPPAQFRSNLRSIVEHFRNTGTRPILVALPSLHPRNGAPDYLVKTGLATSTSAAVEQHLAYAAVVREVAAQERVECVDLAERLEVMAQPERLFLEDGIHLTESGRLWMALELERAIRQDL